MISKLDRSIATIEYLIKRKKEKVNELSNRVELNENQKIFIGQELEMIQAIEVLMKYSRKEFNMQLGKLPPQALDVEESVIGAILIETGIKDAIALGMKDYHFYDQHHQAIFRACSNLNERNEPVDMRTVVFELRRLGALEDAGGATKVAELASKASSTAHIKYHAAIVIQQFIKRQLILLSGETIRKCYDDSTDSFEIADELMNEIKQKIQL